MSQEKRPVRNIVVREDGYIVFTDETSPKKLEKILKSYYNMRYHKRPRWLRIYGHVESYRRSKIPPGVYTPEEFKKILQKIKTRKARELRKILEHLEAEGVTRGERPRLPPKPKIQFVENMHIPRYLPSPVEKYLVRFVNASGSISDDYKLGIKVYKESYWLVEYNDYDEADALIIRKEATDDEIRDYLIENPDALGFTRMIIHTLEPAVENEEIKGEAEEIYRRLRRILEDILGDIFHARRRFHAITN